jgi:hypothetical protein
MTILTDFMPTELSEKPDETCNLQYPYREGIGSVRQQNAKREKTKVT